MEAFYLFGEIFLCPNRVIIEQLCCTGTCTLNATFGAVGKWKLGRVNGSSHWFVSDSLYSTRTSDHLFKVFTSQKVETLATGMTFHLEIPRHKS